MRTKRLTRLALLSAVALGLYVLEAQLPNPIPVAGVKLGLSNIVSIYTLFAYGPWAALGVLLTRVLLGSLFAGQLISLAYSLAGGLYQLQSNDYSRSWPMFTAASILTSVPLLLIFFKVQKYMVSGLTAGGVKG